MYNVRFDAEKNEFFSLLVKGVPAGYSLLEVAIQSGLRLRHNCGMACSCSSCHLYIDKGGEFLEEMDERELEMIDYAAFPRLNSRLGCQCILKEGEGYLEVTIPAQ